MAKRPYEPASMAHQSERKALHVSDESCFGICLYKRCTNALIASATEIIMGDIFDYAISRILNKA